LAASPVDEYRKQDAKPNEARLRDTQTDIKKKFHEILELDHLS
jgi:hypothetical protein